MPPRLSHILMAAGLVIGLLGAVVFALDGLHKHQGAGAEHNAAVASGEANAHQHNAEAQDAAVSDLQAKLKAREDDLGRLNAERDGLLRKLASKPKPNADPAVGPSVGTDDSALEAAEAVIAKDAEIIEAQQILIKNQSEQILVITKARDEWKATAEARERQALAQEAATRAWKDAVTTSRWKGRVEGFAVGLASGYVAGRLK